MSAPIDDVDVNLWRAPSTVPPNSPGRVPRRASAATAPPWGPPPRSCLRWRSPESRP